MMHLCCSRECRKNAAGIAGVQPIPKCQDAFLRVAEVRAAVATAVADQSFTIPPCSHFLIKISFWSKSPLRVFQSFTPAQTALSIQSLQLLEVASSYSVDHLLLEGCACASSTRRLSESLSSLYCISIASLTPTTAFQSYLSQDGCSGCPERWRHEARPNIRGSRR